VRSGSFDPQLKPPFGHIASIGLRTLKTVHAPPSGGQHSKLATISLLLVSLHGTKTVPVL
jgi:hypothetical protein